MLFSCYLQVWKVIIWLIVVGCTSNFLASEYVDTPLYGDILNPLGPLIGSPYASRISSTSSLVNLDFRTARPYSKTHHVAPITSLIAHYEHIQKQNKCSYN